MMVIRMIMAIMLMPLMISNVTETGDDDNE